MNGDNPYGPYNPYIAPEGGFFPPPWQTGQGAPPANPIAPWLTSPSPWVNLLMQRLGRLPWSQAPAYAGNIGAADVTLPPVDVIARDHETMVPPQAQSAAMPVSPGLTQQFALGLGGRPSGLAQQAAAYRQATARPPGGGGQLTADQLNALSLAAARAGRTFMQPGPYPTGGNVVANALINPPGSAPTAQQFAQLTNQGLY